MKFLYTNEKGGKIGHVTAYGPIAAVKIAKILKICCTVGCALIVLQHLVQGPIITGYGKNYLKCITKPNSFFTDVLFSIRRVGGK